MLPVVGQIIFRFSEFVSSEKSSRIENISVFQNKNPGYITPIPSRPEGRIMIATIVGRVAVDAGSADSERRESVRQRRVVLTPRLLASSSEEANASEGRR